MSGLVRTCCLVFALLSAGCASFPRRLAYATLPSESMSREMAYAVWVPHDFRENEQLPLVLFLHGGGDSQDAFDRHGLAAALDRALAEGRIGRSVIVLPEGELGFWSNWRDGRHRYQDWFLRELMPDVQRRYHTQSCPDGCHVMGVSMGGYGTMRAVLDYPGLFASATMISAPLLDTDGMIQLVRSPLVGLIIPVNAIWGTPDPVRVAQDDPYVRWQSPGDLRGTRLMVAYGDQDRAGIAVSGRHFHTHLMQHGVAHHWYEYRGRHAWRDWEGVVIEALRVQVAGLPKEHAASYP